MVKEAKVSDMPLTEQHVNILHQAISNYNYPTQLYDFKENQPIPFETMRELENYLQARLLSMNSSEVKCALANIVYWGNINAGYCMFRVKKFLGDITENQVQRAIDLFPNIEDDGLADIKRIGLPQFSNMSFVSKLRMFLDTANYVTLDKKLLKLKQVHMRTFFSNIKEYPTYIPIDKHNRKQYSIWSKMCRETANNYFRGYKIIAADVERGIFYLVDHGKVNTATTLVANMSEI